MTDYPNSYYTGSFQKARELLEDNSKGTCKDCTKKVLKAHNIPTENLETLATVREE